MSFTVYTRYELLRTFRNRRFLLFAFGFPLVLYVLIAAPNRHVHDLNGSGLSAPLYFMVGLLAFGTMTAMLSSGARIAAERAVGWNRQLRITPLSPRSYLRAKVLTAGLLGLVTYLFVNGLSRAFRPPDLDAVSAGTAVGKAGLSLFLYLEVLDAAFSFDGVTGAFAITSDPIVIALGLGLVGSMFVRSITIFLVQQDALDRYVYLEHDAHWAIGVLFIGAALSWSVLRNRRQAKATASAQV